MSSLLFGIEPLGPRGLCHRDRRHPRGRGARELPAGAARGDDRSDRDAQGGVGDFMNIIGFVDSVGRDLRYALRGLARRPAFTFAAVRHARARHRRDDGDLQRRLLRADQAAAVSEFGRARADQACRRVAAICRPRRSLYLTYRNENGTFADIGVWQGGFRDADRPRRARARARAARLPRHAASARRAAAARTLVHGSGARARGRGAGAGHSLACVLATALRRRRSGRRARALGRCRSRRKSSASCRPISRSST